MEISDEDVVYKAVASRPPQLQLTGETGTSNSYTAICMDLDASFVTAPFLSPILHWIQPGLQRGQAGLLHSEQAPRVPWLAATPPPLSGHHRYTVMLYKQHVGSTQTGREAPISLWQRLRWNPASSAKELGLGEPVALATFRV
ncbi:Hypothetical protein D9617_6g092950 [Elsinoe fawcettii]|nr:Hypothetical protein D9617_6g092950 [Elsinoe fawcettii]